MHHFLCGETTLLRVRLGKCSRHWIVLLNGSKLHRGPVSCILLQKGRRIPVFYQDHSLKGSPYLVSSPLLVDNILMGLCIVDTGCSRMARIRKLRYGGDVGTGVCLTYTDKETMIT